MKKQHHYRELQIRTWQMSFNDLMTVLLTFFILLVSMSNIRMDRVMDISSSAATSFGSRGYEDREVSFIRRVRSVEGIEAKRIEGGVSIVLSESMLYPSGSATIINKEILRRLGEKLKMAGGSVRIEGHTDSIPVANNFFASNWELSTQRAVNAVKFLSSDCGIDPRILSAAGYADSRPIASNDTFEGRALNRRIKIIISLQ